MKIALILAAASLFSVTPGHAQEAPQSISITMRDFARCAVRGDRDSAAALVGSMPSSDAEAMLTKRLKKKYDDCLALPDTARVSPLLMRGSLAAQLYDQLYGFRSPTGIAAQGYGAKWLTGPGAPTGAVAAPYAFAACIASANPQAAHNLTLSTPGSAAENAAFASLSTGFSICYPKGGTMRLNRIAIRALTAEAMYHLAGAQVGAGR
jgi:hypothetical protein